MSIKDPRKKVSGDLTNHVNNLTWRTMAVGKRERVRFNSQKPCVLWLTGLSGSGKSTIADILEQKLNEMNKHTYLLDGDNIRHGLNKDLGFTDAERVENIRRIGEVAKLMVDAGLIVIVSFISPFQSDRLMARSLVNDDEFIEIFVDAPLKTCEDRDPKGLYKRARSGELINFTGIDSVYEVPQNPEIILKSDRKDPNALVDEVLDFLKANRFKKNL